MTDSHHDPFKPRERDLINTKIREIDHPDIVRLLKEFCEISNIYLADSQSVTLGQILDTFLQDPISYKRKPFVRGEFSQIGFSTYTLKRLLREAPEIYRVCHELAQRRNDSAEAYENYQLFSFLNHFLAGGTGGKRVQRRGIPR